MPNNFYNLFPNFKPAQQPQAAPKGRSGVAKWLPTALAVGGTLAAAPFTGGASLLGTAALLGGGAALGGAAGEGFAQKLSGEQTDVGKIGKEAAISGITGAIPIGGAAKAARLSQVAKAGVEDAGASAAQAGRGGFLSRVRNSMDLHGQQMEGRSGGYAVNAKQPGTSELDIASSKKVNTVLNSEKVKGGSPLSRLNQVEGRLKDYGGQIDSIVGQNNVAIGQKERQAIADRYLTSMKTKMGTNEAVMAHAQSLADQFVKNGAKDAKGLINNKRQLDSDLINYIKNPDSALAHEQRAVVPFRQALKDETNNLVPGLKSANNKYHDLSQAKGYLVKGTGEMNARGGIIQRIAESGPIKTGESLTGRVMQKIAGVGAPPPVGPAGEAIAESAAQAAPTAQRGLTSRILREGVKQTVGQTVGGESPLAGSPPPGSSANPTLTNPDTSAALTGTDPLANPDQSQASDVNQQLDAAIQQALASGDTKGLDNLMKVANYYMAKEKASGKSTKPLSSTQQQQANNASSGLAALQTLQGEITKNPNALAKSATPGQTLPLVGGYITNATGTGVLRTARKEAADVISRLRTGAAINAEEEKFYVSQLPQAGDSSEVINYKLNLLGNLFSKFANPQQGSGADVADLTSALQGAQ